jgi:DNA-binding MarR family transcriptional regulator
MSEITYKNAGKQPFMNLVRELVATYQAFTNYDAAGIKQHDLTPPQADVVFTLGNTAGLTFKEIGELTLITKGTLTGVVDRLEEKGLVTRKPGLHDKRCMKVSLTRKGENLFQRVFPEQVSYLKERFDRLSEKDRMDTERLLKKLRTIF